MDVSKICRYANEYVKQAVSPLLGVGYISGLAGKFIGDTLRSMEAELYQLQSKLDQSIAEVENYIKTFSNRPNFASIKPTLDRFLAQAKTTSGLINQILLSSDVSKKPQEAQTFVNAAKMTLQLFPAAVNALQMNKTTYQSMMDYMFPGQIRLESLMKSIQQPLLKVVNQVESALTNAQEQAMQQQFMQTAPSQQQFMQTAPAASPFSVPTISGTTPV